MNKRVKTKMIKDEKQAKILMACACVSLLAGWVFPVAKGVFLGLALGLGTSGAGTYWILKKARNSKPMQEKIMLELDERNQKINELAASKSFWFSFYWIALASIVASFGWVSGRELLLASIFIMPAIYFSLAVYYHKTR